MGNKEKNKTKDKRVQQNGSTKAKNQQPSKKLEKSKVSQKQSLKKPTSYLVKLKAKVNSVLNMHLLKNLVFSPQYFWIVACVFLIIEAALNIFIIENVKYTEIDWQAYMQEVEGFLNGTFDYTKLKGQTGDLVYPAGFLYFFSILYYITNKGQNVYLAQYIFAIIYFATLALVFRLFNKSKKIPPYVLIFICLTSYRIHSIYVLRLFNDPVSMLFLYLAINLFVSGYWTVGSIFFSIGVSVKMNILLFAPALLMAYLYCLGIFRTIFQLGLCVAVQLILAAPFLIANPTGYLMQAFNLGRVFLYEWTINWRFLPEDIFVDKRFHLVLLALQVLLLATVAFTHWRKYLSNYSVLHPSKLDSSSQLFLLPMFMSNFIGIMCSRSLHYQFYVWYFHSLPYLLWSTSLSVKFKILILGLLELCWNTFPSTVWSSALLHACHLVIFATLLFNRPSTTKIQATKKKLQKQQ